MSAKTPEALRAQADALVDFVTADTDVVAVGHALTRRAALNHRAVVVGANRDELLAGLNDLTSPNVVTGSVTEGKLAFLFTGQGSQHIGMGRDLRQNFPVYTEAFDAVCHHFPGLRDIIFGNDNDLLAQTQHAQPAIFALEVALYRLLESWNIHPDYLAGHSIGEITAAHTAGVLNLTDACTLIHARATLMQALPTDGTMIAINATENDIPTTPGVDIAAINGPNAIVLSGDENAVTTLAAKLAEQGHRTKKLNVSHAFHSALMQPMLADFQKVAETLTYQQPTIAAISTVTGKPADHDWTNPEYWVNQIRNTVRYHDTITTLNNHNTTTYLEIGPDANLTAITDGAIPTMKRKSDELRMLARAVGALFTRGVPMDRQALSGGSAVRVPLPGYAFQRERFWLPAATPAADVTAAGMDRADHPLLGAITVLPGSGGVLATGQVSLATHPWLVDHTVAGAVLVPGTALVDMVLRVGAEAGSPTLAELALETPLVVPGSGAVRVQVTVADEDDHGRRAVAVYSRTADAEWTRHASGVLEAVPVEPADLGEWAPATPSRSPSTVSTSGWTSSRSGRVSVAWKGSGPGATTCSPRWSCPRRWRPRPPVSRCTRACSTPRCTPRCSCLAARRTAVPGCRSCGTRWQCTPPARRHCGPGSARWTATASRWR
nr:acyltransferase domain-containing protein [Kutzneria sp. 744]